MTYNSDTWLTVRWQQAKTHNPRKKAKVTLPKLGWDKVTKQPETGFIYVMSLPGFQGCKIGYSVDPARRLGELQGASHSEIKLFWTVQLPLDVAAKTERSIHKILRGTDGHKLREWYWIEPSTAVSVIKTALGLDTLAANQAS